MWIIITLWAIISQLLRNTFSKKISKSYSPLTVSFARFMYWIPIAWIWFYIGQYFYWIPEITSVKFYIYISLFAVSQIIANSLLIMLFNYKNFTVSLTYVKVETIFAWIIALFFLWEMLSTLWIIWVIIAFVWLILSTFSKKKVSIWNIKESVFQKSSYIWLLSGLFFAIAVVFIKKTFEYIETDLNFMKASMVLIVWLFIQTIILWIYLYFKKKKELVSIIKNPKIPFAIWSLWALWSFFCNFAFSLTFIAYVKTLWQIEFIFSVLIYIYYFKEKIYKNEIIWMLLIVIGTIAIVFA